MAHEVEVYSQDTVDWVCGSGCAIGGRLVLTAGHVVGMDPAAVKVRIGSDALLDAKIAWRARLDDADVALLFVTAASWPRDHRRRPVRWGVVVGTAAVRFESVGFPEVQASAERRDSEQLSGTIMPGTTDKSEMLALSIDDPPDQPETWRSPWAGMSGAPVRCEGFLTAVVIEVPPGFGGRRLTALPVEIVARDRAFRDLVAAETGTAIRLEPVELGGMTERPVDVSSPADLLRADALRVAFRHRPEHEELVTWCLRPDALAARVVTGPGGEGKTRLGLELLATLSRRGWATCLLSGTVAPADLAGFATLRRPTLVVVDYAETRMPQLAQLMPHLRDRDEPVRIVLLARNDGPWRSTPLDSSPHLTFLARSAVDDLLPLEPGANGRRAAWKEALAGFASTLGNLRGYGTVDWARTREDCLVRGPSALQSPNVLDIHIAALSDLLEAAGLDTADAHRDAVSTLLTHEARYWYRTADAWAINLTPPTRRRAVVTATLWGAQDEGDALAVLEALPGTADLLLDDRLRVAHWLSTLYEADDRFWAQLRPDRLAAHLVAETLAEPGGTEAIMAVAQKASSDQFRSAFTVLLRGRAEHNEFDKHVHRLVVDHPDRAVRPALTLASGLPESGPLIDALMSLAERGDAETVTRISEAMPRSSVVLSDLRLTVAERLVAVHEGSGDGSVKHHGQRAATLDRYANELISTHRLTEASTSSREANRLHAALYRAGIEGAWIGFAASLGTSARIDNELGHHNSADRYITGAINLLERHREEGDEDTAAHLARALAHSRSNILSALARHEEAVEWTRRCVRESRQVGDPPGSDHEGVAHALELLAARLDEVGHRREAVEISAESVAIRRVLADAMPDQHVPDLVLALNNHAVRLGMLDDAAAAVRWYREAIEHLERLVPIAPDSFRPLYAGVLNNLGNRLGQMGRHREAADLLEPARHEYQRLCADQPGVFSEYLAGTSANLAMQYAALQDERAISLVEQAVELFRDLVRRSPLRHRAALAGSLLDRGYILAQFDLAEQGIAESAEGVDLHRGLVREQSDTFGPELARALRVHAENLAAAFRHAEAVAVGHESVMMFRELSANDPRAHATQWEKSLRRLAEDCAMVGATGQARDISAEAVEVARRIWRRQSLVDGDETDTERLVRALGLLAGNAINDGAFATAIEAVSELQQLLAGASTRRVHSVGAHFLAYVAERWWAAGDNRTATSVMQRAIETWRHAAISDGKIDPDLGAGYLANLVQLSEWLTADGSCEDAIAAYEALLVVRLLAETRPDMWSPHVRNLELLLLSKSDSS